MFAMLMCAMSIRGDFFLVPGPTRDRMSDRRLQEMTINLGKAGSAVMTPADRVTSWAEKASWAEKVSVGGKGVSGRKRCQESF
jgi:hypothetical protein